MFHYHFRYVFLFYFCCYLDLISGIWFIDSNFNNKSSPHTNVEQLLAHIRTRTYANVIEWEWEYNISDFVIDPRRWVNMICPIPIPSQWLNVLFLFAVIIIRAYRAANKIDRIYSARIAQFHRTSDYFESDFIAALILIKCRYVCWAYCILYSCILVYFMY